MGPRRDEGEAQRPFPCARCHSCSGVPPDSGVKPLPLHAAEVVHLRQQEGAGGDAERDGEPARNDNDCCRSVRGRDLEVIPTQIWPRRPRSGCAAPPTAARCLVVAVAEETAAVTAACADVHRGRSGHRLRRAEQAPKDLPGGRLGDLRHTLNCPDALVRRYLPGDECQDRVGIEVVAGRYRERFRDFPGPLVRHADHRAVGNLRVRDQDRLQFGRSDLQALALDQLLDPVGDGEPPSSSAIPRVAACRQPSG